MVVNTTGISASLAASRSFRISDTGPSRSQASGEFGSVNPRFMSITTRAGRRPKPPRPPKPSMWARVLSSIGPLLAELAGEPLVERAAGLGDHAPLLFEGRQIPVVEVGRLVATSPDLLTFGICGSGIYGPVFGDDDAVDVLGGLGTEEVPAYVFGDCLGVALQWISYSTGAGSLEDQPVAIEDGYVAHLGRHLDLFSPGPYEGLLRGRARLAAVHPVGVGVMAVVLVGNAAIGEEAVDLLDAAATPKLAGSAGVLAGRVLLHDHGIVRLHVLRWHGQKLGPPGVPVQPILAGDCWYAAVEDLHGLERLSVLLDPGVDEVGTRPVGTRNVEADGLRVDGAEHVELPRHHDQAVAQGRRLPRAQDRAVGDIDLDDVGVAIVEQDRGGHRGDQEHPGEHLEHLLVEEEIDGARHLGVGAGPVEVQRVCLAPHRELQLYGAVAQPVVVGVVLELEALPFGYELPYKVDDARPGPRQERVAGLQVGVLAEPVADVFDALGSCGGSRGYGHDVGAGLARGAGIVAEKA